MSFPIRLAPLLAAAWLAWMPAQAASLQDDLARVDAEAIERDPAWLALLHYRAGANGAVASQADRPHFFLAADGRTSPRAELLAAVAALHAADTRLQLACRFPARYAWLRDRLQHADHTPIDQCPQLAQWLARFSGRRISINFASSYLESPSSTFGHTFLKVYRDGPDELLSPTINYAARTEAQDSDLQFVFKGLFGGFPGVADELPFYRRLRTYTEVEGRDIHEYQLALTPSEVQRVLLHTWEIRDGIFDYYFVHENCAYRTLALLDVARPGAGLLARFDAVSVPVDTIRALRTAGLLGAHTVWPSIPRHVRGLESQLGPDSAGAARAIALGLRPADTMDAGTLQLAYEYASVLIDRDIGERATRKETLGAIVNARLRMKEPEPLAGHAAPPSPETGHDGALLALGALRRHGRQALGIEYAAFRHSLTDRLAGYEPHAEIAVLNPALDIADGEVRLRRVDWLVAQSTIPSTVLMAPRAWRLALSTSRAASAERDRMATSLAYQSGKAWPLGAHTVLALLPGASLEATRALPHRVGLAGMLHAVLTRQGTDWSAQLKATGERFIGGTGLQRSAIHATGQVHLARNLSLALAAERRIAPRREHTLALSLQWRQRSPGRIWP